MADRNIPRHEVQNLETHKSGRNAQTEDEKRAQRAAIEGITEVVASKPKKTPEASKASKKSISDRLRGL
jgi:hypothetical protein